MHALIQAAASRGDLSANAANNLWHWLSRPEYASYQPTLMAALEEGRFAELEAAFWEILPFGTGGRRGRMGPYGSATVNDRTVAESAAGIARYWLSLGHTAGTAVIAYDCRINSKHFAHLAATTLVACGFHVWLFPGPRATPQLSFAVRHLECSVGLMISASHNPSTDNGVKAYWSNGGQVLPPHDGGIMTCVNAVAQIPTADFESAVQEGQIKWVSDELDAAYTAAVLALSLSPAREIKAVYTPLHGVGRHSVARVLDLADFLDVTSLEIQSAPDGNFPLVPGGLPNPERKEVFDLPTMGAKRIGADLILASDPDADRLGIAVRDATGEFVPLSGNQLGALLVHYVLRKRAQAGTLTPEHYVLETLVTTPMIAAIARAAGVRVVDDLLVGFKYIAETMDELGTEKFVFAAEESLGYLAGGSIRDKDASVAALYALEAAAELKSSGRTLLDQLDELYCRFGYHAERQFSQACVGAAGQRQITAILNAFTNNPPTELAGITLGRVRDYAKHEIRTLPGNAHSAPLPHPKSRLLIFESACGPMSPRQEYEWYLESVGKRLTAERAVLVEEIFALPSGFEIDDIVKQAAKNGGSKRHLSRATIYRGLSELVSAGVLRSVKSPQAGRSEYEHASDWSSCLPLITFAARPSGTEPKIKFYLFARAEVPHPNQLAAVRQATEERLKAFHAALVSWMESIRGAAAES